MRSPWRRQRHRANLANFLKWKTEKCRPSNCSTLVWFRILHTHSLYMRSDSDFKSSQLWISIFPCSMLEAWTLDRSCRPDTSILPISLSLFHLLGIFSSLKTVSSLAGKEILSSVRLWMHSHIHAFQARDREMGNNKSLVALSFPFVSVFSSFRGTTFLTMFDIQCFTTGGKKALAGITLARTDMILR